MKFDIQVPLTTSQFERLKPSKNLKADLANVLPKAKHDRIKPYLGDPAYLPSIVRHFKGKPAYLLLRMKRPIHVIYYPDKIARLIHKAARKENVTVNQFIRAAIRRNLDEWEGK